MNKNVQRTQFSNLLARINHKPIYMPFKSID